MMGGGDGGGGDGDGDGDDVANSADHHDHSNKP